MKMCKTQRLILGDDNQALEADGADVSCVPRKPDIALLTPGRAPRVPDDPVFDTILSTITNAADSMVDNGLKAIWIVVDTSSVLVEVVRASVDANRAWAECADLLLESGLVLVDEIIGGDGADSLGLVEGAPVLDWGVWIVLLAVELTVLPADDVVDGIFGATTRAAEAEVAAVDKVGLGEGEKLVVLECIGRLARLDGAERPAGTAVALVLDWVDDTLLPPVDGVWSNTAAGKS